MTYIYKIQEDVVRRRRAEFVVFIQIGELSLKT